MNLIHKLTILLLGVKIHIKAANIRSNTDIQTNTKKLSN